MARKVDSANEALKNLEQQLTCPVCLDRYAKPRTLPCLHSFCHNCLAHFPVQIHDGKHFITCPVCRQSTQQSDDGASGFQSAFLINNLLELHQVLEKVSGSQQNNCENCDEDHANGFCKQCSKFFCQNCIEMHSKWKVFASHEILKVEDVATTASKLVPLKEQPVMECSSHGKPLEVYCDTCDKLICHLCTINHHRDHKCDAITDAFPRHQQQIMKSIQQVKEKLATITDITQALITEEGDFLEQVKVAKSEIEATVQQLMQLLQESRNQLVNELDQVADAYKKKLSVCKEKTDVTIAQLQTCKGFAEEELRIGSKQEILVMKGQMMERMAAVCSEVIIDSQPLGQPLKFLKSTRVLEACRCGLGSVIKCGKVTIAGDKVSFDICSAAIPLSSEIVSCQLSPVADPAVVIKCALRQVPPESFVVHCFSRIAGIHQLRVLVEGIDILGTPLNIEVMPKRAEEAFTGLSDPSGLAIGKEGHLIVAECGNHCITIVDPANGRKIKNFGQPGFRKLHFNKPEGVAVTQDGRIIVADNFNHRLQVLSADGAFIGTIGSKGQQPLQFLYPESIAVHDNGKVFVTEYHNNRVQVLNAELSYSHCFGSKGSQPGEFIWPCGIAIDAEGLVYVSDSGNNRIQKFTPEGKLVGIISNKGIGAGLSQLNGPYGLCIDKSNILYVTEWHGDTVSVFSLNGKFLGYLGDSDGSSFQHPCCIAVSSQTGRLYISDDNVVTMY